MSLNLVMQKIKAAGGEIKDDDSDLVKRRKGIWIIALIQLKSWDTLRLRDDKAKEAAFMHIVKASQILERAL
jgi:hypothetical protein